MKVDLSVYRLNRLKLIHADEPRNPDTQKLIDPESIIPLSEADELEITAAIIYVHESHPELPRRSQRKHRLPIWLNNLVLR